MIRPQLLATAPVSVPVIAVFTTLTACSSLKEYDVTFNERLVYSARPLAVDVAVTDTALATCIGQFLKDTEAKSATALAQLNCTQAGIRSLAGIEIYAGLTQVKLADNNIRDPEPLAALAKLEFLDLTGNTELTCSVAETLRVATLSLPEHCGS